MVLPVSIPEHKAISEKGPTLKTKNAHLKSGFNKRNKMLSRHVCVGWGGVGGGEQTALKLIFRVKDLFRIQKGGKIILMEFPPMKVYPFS